MNRNRKCYPTLVRNLSQKSKRVQTSALKCSCKVFQLSKCVCVFLFQAVVQVQESLQQQVQQVSFLLQEADRHNLPAAVLHQATQLQVC